MLGVDKLRSTLPWLGAVALFAVLAFFAGRWSAHKTVTTTTTTSSTTATTTTGTTTQQVKVEYRDRVVYRNQATLKQDRDTDCTEDFDRVTGKLTRRHCTTKTSTTGTTTTSGGSTTEGHGSSTSTTTGTTTSTTSSTTTTKTEVGAPARDWKGLSLSAVASLTLLDSRQLTLSPSYGIILSKSLVGPLSLQAAVYTDSTAALSLGLDLGRDWAAYGGVSMGFSDIAHGNFRGLAYGGGVDRRLFGPVWLGAWGYSNGSAGLAASITVP